MNNEGSMIRIHYHNNIDILKEIDDINGILYYKKSPIMVDDVQYNLLSKFSYLNGSLLFDGMVVSQEYIKSQITMMITDLWNELEQNDTGGDVNDTTEP